MNRPEDRMLLIGENLINVDDISTVSAKHQEAVPMLGVTESKWLEIITLAGTKVVVDTDMTIREFEIERAKKFTPVSLEKTEAEKLAGVDWYEDGWDVGEVRTQWFYYIPGMSRWVIAENMSIAMEEAKRLRSSYKAVMQRTVSKEWGIYGMENG